MAINKITPEDVEAFKQTRTLDAYQHIAGKSAVYPGQGFYFGLIYTSLKLNGEAGELAENVGKAMRDDELMISGKLTPERRAKLVKELGDVLWYVAATAKELGYHLSGIAEVNLEKLRDRGERGTLQGSGDER